MEFTLGLAQCCHSADASVDSAVKLVDEWCARAKARHVDMLVFPESLMTRYEAERHAFLAEAQSLDGSFGRSVDALAKKYGMWLVYTMNEKNAGVGGAAHEMSAAGANDDADNGGNKSAGNGSTPRMKTDENALRANVSTCAGVPRANANEANGARKLSSNPFNTAVLVDSMGKKRGVYRKTHLFDTDFTRESDRMTAGDRLFEPVCTPFGRIGLAICYDLRFPEVARYEALAGCDVLIVPAAWVDGPAKAAQWKTLLAARAIENQMFVAGVSRADAGYVGQSCVFGPMGASLAEGGREEELVVARISLDELESVRKSMPVLTHRRPELYGKHAV